MTRVASTTLSADSSNPDATLHLIAHHDQLCSAWDKLDDDDPRTSELSDESTDLLRRIFLSQPSTERGVAEKRRILEEHNFELYGAETLIEWVLEADAERVGVKRPGRPRKADVVESVAAT